MSIWSVLGLTSAGAAVGVHGVALLTHTLRLAAAHVDADVRALQAGTLRCKQKGETLNSKAKMYSLPEVISSCWVFGGGLRAGKWGCPRRPSLLFLVIKGFRT